MQDECLAQNKEIKFNLVEPPNIGPLGNITAITQDQYGYMWFSGQQKNCLYRYDGVKMIIYKNNSQDTNSLGGGNLETVYADSKGLIWIGFSAITNTMSMIPVALIKEW